MPLQAADDLFREPLLELRTSGVEVHHLPQMAQADDALLGM